MQIRTLSRLQPSAEAQPLPRSTQNTSIAELPIQRSGFIVDQWSCAFSFQSVIPWLPLFTLRKGAQDLLSYTTRRGATLLEIFSQPTPSRDVKPVCPGLEHYLWCNNIQPLLEALRQTPPKFRRSLLCSQWALSGVLTISFIQ